MSDNIDMKHIDWRNSLLTSLYSQVEFLKAEIEEKNEVNAKLLELIKSYQINQLNYVKPSLIRNNSGLLISDLSGSTN